MRRSSSHHTSSAPRAKKSERGFTLLLAALVATIVLSIGTAIYTIAQKQLTLSSVGQNSQYAFYAADTGGECALFWDTRTDISTHAGLAFATSTSNALTQIECDDQTIPLTVTHQGSTWTTTFQYHPNGYCVNVQVIKSHNLVSNGINTTVRSDGFSTPCTSVGTNPQALQRSIELNY